MFCPVRRLIQSSCKLATIRGLSRETAKSNQAAVSQTGRTTDLVEEPPNLINPLEHEDFFGARKIVTVKDLFDSKVHIGHKSGTRNIHMRPYIFGSRLGVDIIDLDQTLSLLQDALNFTAHIAYREGVILFISRHKQTLPLVERAAIECGEYSHCRTWHHGTFTNAAAEFGSLTRLPDLCIFMSTHKSIFEEHEALIETAKLNIPSIGILDTSCDGRYITYPVPGNDDSPSAVQLYCNLFKEAVLLGKQKRNEMEHKHEQKDTKIKEMEHKHEQKDTENKE